MKGSADNNFKIDGNGRKFFLRIGNTVWKKYKLLVTSNFCFFHSVPKRLLMQTHLKTRACLGKVNVAIVW